VSLCHCVTVTVSLCHCVTVPLCHCVTVSLCHCATVSLRHSFTEFLNPRVPVSLSSCIAVSLCHCVTVSLCHCVTVSLCHCVTVSLCHCVTVQKGAPGYPGEVSCVDFCGWHSNFTYSATSIKYFFSGIIPASCYGGCAPPAMSRLDYVPPSEEQRHPFGAFDFCT